MTANSIFPYLIATVENIVSTSLGGPMFETSITAPRSYLHRHSLWLYNPRLVYEKLSNLQPKYSTHSLNIQRNS